MRKFAILRMRKHQFQKRSSSPTRIRDVSCTVAMLTLLDGRSDWNRGRGKDFLFTTTSREKEEWINQTLCVTSSFIRDRAAGVHTDPQNHTYLILELRWPAHKIIWFLHFLLPYANTLHPSAEIRHLCSSIESWPGSQVLVER